MRFSSLPFLFGFLPITLAIYFAVPLRWRNLALLLASLVFYGWGEPVYISIMVLSILIDYTHGLLVEKYRSRDKLARWFVAESVLLNLGLLGFFKYWDFFAANLSLIPGVSISALGLPLPIGISFFTFQTMSYTIDIYRQDAPAQRNMVSFGAYVTMFPQLVAGPIVRYADIAQQLQQRSLTLAGMQQGITRFMCGLGKKIVLANSAGEAAGLLLDSNLSQLSVAGAWLGILLYALQIYFDFSGYSDMAIGLGRMFGFHYQENFRYPYLSCSITDFWRRWHISLGFFFRDYVYIPLGGNRRYQLRNIMVVWALTGLWHGASWNFVCWGLYYGCLLMLEKKWLLHVFRMHPILGWCCTAVAVLFGWALFYYTDFAQLQQFLLALCGLQPAAGWVDVRAVSVWQQYFWLLPILLVGTTPYPARLFARWQQREFALPLVQMTGILALGLLCLVWLVGQSYNPFLYFRF